MICDPFVDIVTENREALSITKVTGSFYVVLLRLFSFFIVFI